MKKIIFAIFIVINIFIPTYTNALDIKEIYPEVEVQGIDKDRYNIIKTIKNNEILISIEEKSTKLSYSWIFNKDKIDNKITIDFNIDFESSKKQEIDSIAGDIDKLYVSFSHHGNLPQDTKVKVPVSKKFKNGDKLYLYYYNEEKKQIEFIDKDIEVKDGYALFEVDHCSEYLLTGAIVNDAKNNPKSLNSIIVALIIILIFLMSYTIFRK